MWAGPSTCGPNRSRIKGNAFVSHLLASYLVGKFIHCAVAPTGHATCGHLSRTSINDFFQQEALGLSRYPSGPQYQMGTAEASSHC